MLTKIRVAKISYSGSYPIIVSQYVAVNSSNWDVWILLTIFPITYCAIANGSTCVNDASSAIYEIRLKTLSKETSSFLSYPSLRGRLIT